MDNDVFTLTVQVDPVVPVVTDTAQDTTPLVLADDSFATDTVAAMPHNPLDDAQQSVTFDIAPNVTVDLNGFTMDDYLALIAQFGGAQELGASFAGAPHTTLYVGDGHFYV